MSVLLDKRTNGVAIVTLDRPQVLNALDVPAKERLGAIWQEIADDTAVRVAILTGAGTKAFCAGSDIKEINRTGRMVTTDTLLRAIPGVGIPLLKPVIAALHGYCIGMGMTLPFLTRAVVRDANAAGRGIALLYGVNTVGAVCGVFASTFALLPWLGVRGSNGFGAGLYLVLNWFLPALAGLNQIDSHALLPVVLDRALQVVLALLPILAFVALADFLYVRWDYGNRMKMSRRELREEYKQREGDPRIRARIRELRQEMLKRSKSLKRVKDADVLITNPQHLAVALLYKRGEMAAPQVIAKGAGELAVYMRALARKSGVPVVENRTLARSLYRTVDLDHPVPESLYAQVARVLTWVYAARAARPAGGG